MPLAPPIAMSQGTAPAAFSGSLRMDGQEFMPFPGSAPAVAVPVDSIELTEAGPGGISSLRFTIEDPGTTSPLPHNGSRVLFWDRTNDFPLFRGTVNSWHAIPLGVGRRIVVECDGLEKELDSIVTGYTTISLANVQNSVNEVAGLFTRLDNIGMATTENGTRALPIGQLGTATTHPFADFPVTIEGGTVREAIRQIAAAASMNPAAAGKFQLPPPMVTVDFYGGLRMWNEGEQPDDYTTLTITNTAAGTRATAGIDYEVHPADIVHEVYVNGASAAASGWFGDGTGIVGRQAYISDSTVTTEQQARNVATAYLLEQQSNVRGSFKLDDFNPTLTIHAGSLVSITDASLGLSAQTFIIQQIRKAFYERTNRQEWEVSFGGRRPSAMGELRNLTRSVLS